MTAVLPSGVVTVAFPLSSTTTVEPGFTALTLSSIAFFSSGVRASGFATTVLSAGLTMSLPAFGLVASSGDLTKSVAGMTAVLPSGVVTVAFPLSSTTTVEPGFTALTLSSILKIKISEVIIFCCSVIYLPFGKVTHTFLKKVKYISLKHETIYSKFKKRNHS